MISPMSTVSAAPPLAVETKPFIDGRFVAGSGGVLDVRNPAREEPLAAVEAASPEQVDAAVAAARKAFETWGTTSAAERAKILHRTADLIDKYTPELGHLETLNVGKTILETRGGDIPRAAMNLRFFADFARDLSTDAIFTQAAFLGQSRDFLNYVVHDPVGVAALIPPFNSPLMQATWKAGPALAFGNTAVLKPSPLTPLTSLRLAELFAEAGLPEGVFNVVPGGSEVGSALSAHPDVDLISFTGSTMTGRAIAAAAAPTLKRLSLEMGGKSPNLVFADCDLDLAVRGSVRAVFRNQGQVCLAGTRLFVEDSIYDTFMDKFTAAAKAMKLGDPLEEHTELGSTISSQHAERVRRMIRHGIDEGCTLLAGGDGVPTVPEPLAARNYLEPTIFVDVPKSAEVYREEIFGPVVVVDRFHSDEEAVRLANDTPYGLAAMLWTNNLARAHRVGQQIRAGTIWINSFFIRDLRAPFGGQKASGMGREGGKYSLDFFTEPKTICLPY
jgi:aminomuconate-semialdehyde/2-hydroxymuconate-6-semialdehyde dehydrogenase